MADIRELKKLKDLTVLASDIDLELIQLGVEKIDYTIHKDDLIKIEKGVYLLSNLITELEK